MQDEDRSPAIGRVLARAFATIGDTPRAVFGVAFVLAAVPQGLATVAGGTVAGLDDPGLWFLASSGSGTLVALLSSALLQGALVHIAVERSEGGRASIAQALWSGVRSAVPLIVLGLLMALGIALGAALLFVPGIMLWVAWSVAAPALAAERCGILAAFGRSRDLTRGARWKVFALKLLVLVLYWLFAAVMGATGIVVSTILGNPTGVTTAALTVAAIGKTLTAAVAGTIQCSLYIDLRDWKDGPASNRLADIFA